MTIQDKAIEQLERISEHLAAIGETEDYTDIAIQALEQQPYEDCISRESVIEWLKDKDIIKMKNQEENARRELAALPSVTPKQKVGKWKVYEYEHFFDYNKTESKILMCSECETQFLSNREQFIEWANYNIHYCPNCGAKMEVEDENKTK